MLYRLIDKASVRTPDFRVEKGDTITDAQFKSLDARRKAWFEKVVEKAKRSRKKSNVQPLPVEEPRPDPIPAE